MAKMHPKSHSLMAKHGMASTIKSPSLPTSVEKIRMRNGNQSMPKISGGMTTRTPKVAKPTKSKFKINLQ